MKSRAKVFHYAGLEIEDDTVRAHYDLDGRAFIEEVRFEGVGSLDQPAVREVAKLWYLLAGLSYYKAGAALSVDVGATPLGQAGRALLEASLVDGLGEFAYRNDLSLDDVTITGGTEVTVQPASLDARAVLTPFGGGIDSVVSVTQLSSALDQALFIMSPACGRFAPLEATAAVTGLSVVRAQRTLDPQILSPDEAFWHGHVPVTAMVTLLAVTAAVASGRGGVVMSNEHSASEANLRWRDQDVNHQWSKSWVAEELLARAVAERIGEDFCVASFLRDRSELWVAARFAEQRDYHHVFRSCNRAFSHDVATRPATWCGVCDKCLFINLVLAPFLSRAELRAIFHAEPLANPDLAEQLASLVGLGEHHKPFECVGDPDESAVALERVADMDVWSDVAALKELARRASPDRTFEELLEPQGPSRVPAHWFR
jgi:hypothetical protein